MPGQKIDRTCNNSFLEQVKTKRIEHKDNDKLNNYCAVQVNFEHGHTQDAIAFSVRPASSEQFSVGNHSEVRAIARCIYQELQRDSTTINISGLDSTFLQDGFINASGDTLAKQVEIFFKNNPGCLTSGYSDRQPCKEPSFATDNPSCQYQGCERFLQKILPGERHKIDYSFEYVKRLACKKDSTLIPQHFQYEYDDAAIQKTFKQELQVTIPKPKPQPKSQSQSISQPAKPSITYFQPKSKPEIATTSLVAKPAPLPIDTGAHSSMTTNTSGPLERFNRENPATWEAADADLAKREAQSAPSQESDQSSQPLWEPPSAHEIPASHEEARENPIKIDSESPTSQEKSPLLDNDETTLVINPNKRPRSRSNSR